MYSEWDYETDQYYREKLNLEVIPFDTKYYEARDQMAFEMVENVDQLARDTLLQIIQRGKDPAKISGAQSLINSIDSSDVDNRYL